MSSPFLRAEWRNLAMLNFEVDPAGLRPRVPRGTELDSWAGRAYASMVGFLFLRTRVVGVRVPFHTDFEEVNLRFYVRRRAAEGWRRGVVFVKELVPRLAIAWTARTFFNENYVAVPMSHRIERAEAASADVRSASYEWRSGGRENRLSVSTAGPFSEMPEGGDEEFIAEHYWGYCAQRDGSTLEYRVEHPRWRVAKAREARLECDVAAQYGSAFSEALGRPPASAFLAEGSQVTVHRGVRLEEEA